MIADMRLMSPFINAGYAGYELDAGRWPVFANFVERVKAHAVVNQVLEAEAAVMGRD